MTIGTLTVEDGKLLTHETVSGKAGGVTEVRSTIQMRPDGTYLIRTQQCKDGVWGPGRETVYREASGASVVFREVR